MEQTLDDISNGEAERLPYLTSFYAGSDGLVEQVKSKEETIDPREACSLKLDNVEPVVRVGRFGPYFEQQTNGKKLTVSIPNDVAPAEISGRSRAASDRGKGTRRRALGPRSRYGAADLRPCRPVRPLFAIGRSEGGRTEAAPRQHSQNDFAGEHHARGGRADCSALPRTLGDHPESGKPVRAGIGRFGPYVVHEATPKVYKSFGPGGTFELNGRRYDVFDVDLPTAIEMLKQARKRASATPLRELGQHPEDGTPIADFRGALRAVRQIRTR